MSCYIFEFNISILEYITLIEQTQQIQHYTNKYIMTSYNVLDLFCGAGGMSKGLTDAGLNIVAGIDIWDSAISNYKKNFKHIAMCEDLTKLSPADFITKYKQIAKTDIMPTIDIIINTAPCTSYSIGGKREIGDPRDLLFEEFIKYLEYFNPRAFLIENVIGILSKKDATGELIIDTILSKLTPKYNTIVCKLYASDFGVPQNRRRVIIIGIRKDLGIIPTEPQPINTVENRPAIKTILLPRDEIPPKQYLSKKAIDGIIAKKQKSKESGKGFGAQFADFDKPSYTIPARFWRDSYDCLIKYSDTEIRRLTILELKRIQSFPDDYILEGTKREIIEQIGNAVACKFAYHLGLHLIKMLSGGF